MTEFRFYYEVAGGHTHVRLFVGKNNPRTAGGLAGSLTFRNEEWMQFRALVGYPGGVEEACAIFKKETDE